MPAVPTEGRRQKPGASIATIDPLFVLNSLADPVLVVDGDNRFLFVNLAAEQLLGSSAATLLGQPLTRILPADNPVFSLIRQVRDGGYTVSEYGVTLENPKMGSHEMAVNVMAISEQSQAVSISLKSRTIARKIEHQLVHRNAARSVTAMSAMLAHEIKNPLSGIRGAAQLLEANADQADRELTQLICSEADRIVALVDRMEMFSDERPIDREAVNIHEVLSHVRKIAANGFAQQVRILERYDPSLPPVLGNRDLLIQVFLNLVKNAAEALPKEEGEIVLSTRYQQGVRLALPGTGGRVDVPLLVGVQDNGSGIPSDLQGHLFEPFVSSKVNGKGLGLALAAKVIGNHGGIIEFDSVPRRTEFRVMLPTTNDPDRNDPNRNP
jgi:two-component system nitrogen regulation sensor histidine kinase GlnL